jgi:hypothetical protein
MVWASWLRKVGKQVASSMMRADTNLPSRLVAGRRMFASVVQMGT